MQFVDHRFTPGTGSILLRAAMPNQDGSLISGADCQVRIVGEPREALLVPRGSIQADKRGAPFVFVVNEQKRIEVRLIETGNEHDGMRVVRHGLKEGDLVATDILGETSLCLATT